MEITKKSRIVELFSNDAKSRFMVNSQDIKNQIDKGELNSAKEYIKELSSKPSPDHVYEIAQIMSFVIDSLLESRLNYLDLLADVKHTAYGERAQFQVQYNGLKAFYQAKSTSTERSKLSNKYVRLDTDEVSIRPVVDFLELQTGKQDLVDVAAHAAERLDVKIAQRIQDTVFTAFSGMQSPNFKNGAGIVAANFNPIIYAMARIGGGVTVVGDREVLAGLTDLTGYSNYFSQELINETNQNGLIGKYKGANIVQLNNPYQPDQIQLTELRKDLIYAVPAGDAGLRPIKVALEGPVQFMSNTNNINSKAVEFRFDQYVGVGVVGARKALGVYQDTTFTA